MASVEVLNEQTPKNGSPAKTLIRKRLLYGQPSKARKTYDACLNATRIR